MNFAADAARLRAEVHKLDRKLREKEKDARDALREVALVLGKELNKQAAARIGLADALEFLKRPKNQHSNKEAAIALLTQALTILS